MVNVAIIFTLCAIVIYFLGYISGRTSMYDYNPNCNECMLRKYKDEQ